METSIFTRSIPLRFFLIAILAVGACETTTESNDRQQLVIEEGTIERSGTSPSGDVIYDLNFTYRVTSEACEVGGYRISFETGQVFSSLWYKKQFLEPGKKYVRSERFTINAELETGPTLGMRGYLVNSSDSHKGLVDEKIIHLK